MSRRVLVVRSDNCGDVILAGPAVRAVATTSEVVLLTGPRSAGAGDLLPGVDETATLRLPWIDPDPIPWKPGDAALLQRFVEKLDCQEAVVLTSFHQSALPLALLLREAGVGRITAVSEDFPGNLVDVRSRPAVRLHEVERNLAVAADAGYILAATDDGRLQVSERTVSPPADADVVVHPGASVPTRAIPHEVATAAVRALAAEGHRVAVTGSPNERSLTAAVAGRHGLDLGGCTDLRELAALLRGTAVVVCGNTGVAHLAAAVSTPVVSFFAPVMSWDQWRPYGVPTRRIGDQSAACAGTRARACPAPGHPCVSGVDVHAVVAAVAQLMGAQR